MHSTLQTELSAAQQLTAVLMRSGFAPLNDTGWIRITGSDRVRWLNGMLTNSTQDVLPGQGCYNFALNSQGRILGDANAFRFANDAVALWLETERSHVPDLMAHLDHFVIMDDVELADVTPQRSGWLLAGTNASTILQEAGLPAPGEPLANSQVEWNGTSVIVVRAYGPLVPRFELWTDAASTEEVASYLSTHATPIAPEAIEYLRVLEGTPRYGADLRNTDKAHDLPQETAPVGTQSRALHFAKGCYLGQEIVERIRSRGNVHKAFSAFELSGTAPSPGTTLQAEGKPAGELTTVASIPLHGRTIQLALGYVRRDALDRKLGLDYPGGKAVPVALPYRAALERQI